MNKKTVRWGTDIGCPKQIKPLDVRNELSAHGLKGKRAKGELGLSRGITRKEARRDAEDAIPASEAMTQDQWSERIPNRRYARQEPVIDPAPYAPAGRI